MTDFFKFPAHIMFATEYLFTNPTYPHLFDTSGFSRSIFSRLPGDVFYMILQDNDLSPFDLVCLMLTCKRAAFEIYPLWKLIDYNAWADTKIRVSPIPDKPHAFDVEMEQFFIRLDMGWNRSTDEFCYSCGKFQTTESEVYDRQMEKEARKRFSILGAFARNVESRNSQRPKQERGLSKYAPWNYWWILGGQWYDTHEQWIDAAMALDDDDYQGLISIDDLGRFASMDAWYHRCPRCTTQAGKFGDDYDRRMEKSMVAVGIDEDARRKVQEAFLQYVEEPEEKGEGQK